MAKTPIVCIDAGHYGNHFNRSPVVPEFYESNMAWTLHLLLKKELESYGIQVITTRIDKAKDLTETKRGKASAGCDLFVSLHANWASDESTDYPLACVPVDGKMDKLGKELADMVAKLMGTRQTGRIYKRKNLTGKDWYGVLRGATSVGTPGIILEHSFYTNAKAARWLMSDTNLAVLAKAEAEVIANYFGVKKPTSSPKPYTLELPQLYKGCKGELVKSVQAMLIERGYACGASGVDGSFGGATDKAVRAFQQDCELKVDGFVGYDTMSALMGL